MPKLIFPVTIRNSLPFFLLASSLALAYPIHYSRWLLPQLPFSIYVFMPIHMWLVYFLSNAACGVSMLLLFLLLLLLLWHSFSFSGRAGFVLFLAVCSSSLLPLAHH